MTSMVAAPEGYTLIAGDGGVFSFGPAYLGSGANVAHTGVVVGSAGWIEGAS